MYARGVREGEGENEDKRESKKGRSKTNETSDSEEKRRRKIVREETSASVASSSDVEIRSAIAVARFISERVYLSPVQPPRSIARDRPRPSSAPLLAISSPPESPGVTSRD